MTLEHIMLTHGFPKTGRHLAQDFENQNWPCQARGSDKFLNETAKQKEWESAQTLVINPLLYMLELSNLCTM